MHIIWGKRYSRNENTEMVKIKTNNALHRSEYSLFLMRLQSPESRFLSFWNIVVISTLSVPSNEGRARSLEPLIEPQQSHLCSKYSSQNRQHSSAGAVPAKVCSKYKEKRHSTLGFPL